MFVGHYGPAFAAKALKKTIPLWLLFVAVQFVDVLWATFVLLGVEKVRIVPGITAANPLDLYYMPYSHSLVAALLWSIAAALAFRVFAKTEVWAALLVGAAVFSHWVLDLLVHRPDLSLYDSRMKMGFGLWNYPILSFTLEILVLFAGLFFYLRRTQAVTPGGRYGMILFGVALLGAQGYVLVSPPPPSDTVEVVMALIAYASFAVIAALLERQRK
jgi:hypothetical protein